MSALRNFASTAHAPERVGHAGGPHHEGSGHQLAQPTGFGPQPSSKPASVRISRAIRPTDASPAQPRRRLPDRRPRLRSSAPLRRFLRRSTDASAWPPVVDRSGHGNHRGRSSRCGRLRIRNEQGQRMRRSRPPRSPPSPAPRKSFVMLIDSMPSGAEVREGDRVLGHHLHAALDRQRGGPCRAAQADSCSTTGFWPIRFSRARLMTTCGSSLPSFRRPPRAPPPWQCEGPSRRPAARCQDAQPARRPQSARPTAPQLRSPAPPPHRPFDIRLQR